jgi:hypothetical protein
MKRRGLRGRDRRGKGLDRRGARAQKAAPFVRARTRPPHDPTFCLECGAVYRRKVWRQLPFPKVDALFLSHRPEFAACPSCALAKTGRPLGRIRLRGGFVAVHEDELRRRIANVAARAAYTQPERRLLGVAPTADGLEVTVTSQKLAHRIAHELEKAFRGDAAYSWSDRDGALAARWERR